MRRWLRMLCLSAALLAQPTETTQMIRNRVGGRTLQTFGTQFLIISSPLEKKVVWTTLENTVAPLGRTFSLVDDGLTLPKGIALDHKNGLLYVADPGAKRILSYTLMVQAGPKLMTNHDRTIVYQGAPVEQVTVDDKGNLFYTAKGTNSINKITTEVLEKIRLGKFSAGALTVVSEKTVEKKELDAEKTAEAAAKLPPQLPTDRPRLQPHILSIYEGSLNPHVSAPGGIAADGADLYWTNEKRGKEAGTVVQGEVTPHEPTSALKSNHMLAFPAVPLTNVSNAAYSLAKGDDIMFFTRNGTVPGTGLVSGFKMSYPNLVLDFAASIQKPRGLVFNGDDTVYVADEEGGYIWSFPSGRLMNNAPLSQTVEIKGAYGLALFKANKVTLAEEGPNSTTSSEDL